MCSSPRATESLKQSRYFLTLGLQSGRYHSFWEDLTLEDIIIKVFSGPFIGTRLLGIPR
jgi:hypothetical protein